MINIKRTDAANPDFIQLTRLLDEYLAVKNGVKNEFFSQFNKIDMIKNVVVVYDQNAAVGCGAFKYYDSRTVEIKRMFVRPEYRRRGLAKLILFELEKWAEENGFEAAVLETADFLGEAVSLYFKSDYNRIPNFGQYENEPNSVCMKKELI